MISRTEFLRVETVIVSLDGAIVRLLIRHLDGSLLACDIDTMVLEGCAYKIEESVVPAGSSSGTFVPGNQAAEDLPPKAKMDALVGEFQTAMQAASGRIQSLGGPRPDAEGRELVQAAVRQLDELCSFGDAHCRVPDGAASWRAAFREAFEGLARLESCVASHH